MAQVELNGRDLDIATARRIVLDGAEVCIAREAEEAMARGRAIVGRYVDEGIAAYGVTTGLGARADEALPRKELAEFSRRMVRGRAQGVGPCLDRLNVRAVLLARLNSLLNGAAGASLEVARFIAQALNLGLVPAMPGIASVGAGDLVAMAAAAHAFIGEGEMLAENGARLDASEALARAGLQPLKLGPKDGLVLCNNAAFSTGIALRAVFDAESVADALNGVAALSLFGFQASPTPFDEAVVALRPQAGQVRAAHVINALLRESAAWPAGRGRRLQDPLSFRCIAQVNGAVLAQLETLGAAVECELNGVSDNPVVLVKEGRIVSSGNFHTPWLSQCLDSMARALAMASLDSVSRIHRLMSEQMSGLPPLLSSHETGRAGFGPLLKPIEALRGQIVHLANPVPLMSSFNADGVEDALTFAALAGQKLNDLTELMRLVLAYEALAAAQAIDLRGQGRPAGRLGEIYAAVRSVCAMLEDDRPVGRMVEALAGAIAEGELSGITQ
jgi:histidine ammonia-lyase